MTLPVFSTSRLVEKKQLEQGIPTRQIFFPCFHSSVVGLSQVLDQSLVEIGRTRLNFGTSPEPPVKVIWLMTKSIRDYSISISSRGSTRRIQRQSQGRCRQNSSLLINSSPHLASVEHNVPRNMETISVVVAVVVVAPLTRYTMQTKKVNHWLLVLRWP